MANINSLHTRMICKHAAEARMGRLKGKDADKEEPYIQAEALPPWARQVLG